MRHAGIALLLSGAMAGCATTIDMSRPPPPDWPQLEEVVASVPESEVKRVCASANLMVGYACTKVVFPERRCYIYLASADPAVLEHERLHCRGYDHPGEASMRDAWVKWKRLRD